MSMRPSSKKEDEFNAVITSQAQFINFQVLTFNLPKHGLDPEDVIQDIKIRIWKLICKEKIIKYHRPYIRKIIYSSIIDHIRKHRREEDLYRLEAHRHISELESSYNKESLRTIAMAEIVGKAVELLIETRRQVVKLYLLNLNIREIADYLGMSQDKIRNLLYRGLADLRKLIKNMDTLNEDRQ
jgi:RNA polymerase sigma-70 factor (ECF subfamily)